MMVKRKNYFQNPISRQNFANAFASILHCILWNCKVRGQGTFLRTMFQIKKRQDFLSFSGLFHNLETGNYLCVTSYGSSEHCQSPLIFHTGCKSISEISTQWDELRSCDLQDSSVLKLFPHLLHKTPTLWDIIWHFINLSVFLTFPQISQEKTSFSSVKSSSTAVTCDQMFATCVENNQIFVPTSENTWNYESGGTRQCAEQSYAPWKKEK